MELKHFKLEKVDLDKIEHYKLAKKIARSEQVEYISSHFIDYLKKEQTENYILKTQEDHPIGMMGKKTDPQDRILELWCILDRQERNQGIGKRFLGEITPYLIEHENIRDIKLVIKKENIASRKTALANGYVFFQPVDHEKDEFRYFGK